MHIFISGPWLKSEPWRENHHYCRTTLSIMPLGWLSAIQCNWLRWSNWDHTADLTSPCVCSATIRLNIKHPYQLHPFKMTGDCPQSNQLHFILVHRKLIFIYIIAISGNVSVNIQVRSPPSWNSVFGTMWLRFSSRPRFRTWARRHRENFWTFTGLEDR